MKPRRKIWSGRMWATWKGTLEKRGSFPNWTHDATRGLRVTIRPFLTDKKHNRAAQGGK